MLVFLCMLNRKHEVVIILATYLRCVYYFSEAQYCLFLSFFQHSAFVDIHVGMLLLSKVYKYSKAWKPQASKAEKVI